MKNIVALNPAFSYPALREVLDWLWNRKDRPISKRPAGFLVNAIKYDYAPPKGFIAQRSRATKYRENQSRD